MANLLQRAMKENESPAEQFERIGLPEYTAVTHADIQKLHESMKSQPVILEEYSWTRGAINAYRTLMKFVPEDQRERISNILAKEISACVKDDVVTPKIILDLIPGVIAKEYVDMIQYFVGLSARTS